LALLRLNYTFLIVYRP